MRTLLFFAVALTMFGVSPAKADEEQHTLTIKKGNETRIIKIDPATAAILQKSIQNGNRIKIVTDDDDRNKRCNHKCQREREEEAYFYGYLTGQIFDN